MNEIQSVYAINEYIKQPCDAMALLLTAPWGVGKSYFLQQQTKLSRTTVMISLCGMTSVQELRQCVCQTIRMCDKSQTQQQKENVTGAFISGLARMSPFGDLYDALQKNYYDNNAFLDFTRYLVVFEDIERTDIPINQLLGYIKNLMESQHAKVLMVMNHAKLKHQELYDEIKEKIIGTVIHFHPNQLLAMHNLCNQEQYPWIQALWTDELYDKLEKPINLRTFMTSLQTANMLYKLCSQQNIELQEDELKILYMSTCLLRAHYEYTKFPSWNTNQLWQSNIKPFHITFPLWSFVYIYCVAQEFNASLIRAVLHEWRKHQQQSAQQLQTIQVLSNLRASLTTTDENVKSCLKSVLTELQQNTIEFHNYGEIIEYLLLFENTLQIKIQPYLRAMKQNVMGKAETQAWKTAFSGYLSFPDDINVQKYQKLINELQQVAQQTVTPAPVVIDTEELLQFHAEFNEQPLSQCNITNICNNIAKWDIKTVEILRLRLLHEYDNPEINLKLQDAIWIQMLANALPHEIHGDYVLQLQHKWLRQHIDTLLQHAQKKYHNIAYDGNTQHKEPTPMKYVRVMNGVTSHASGYQFKLNEVNIADAWNPAADNPKDFGGFNFTDKAHVLRWMIRGDTLYDVEIPEDAEVVAVENGNTPGGVWRTNQIIVKNPRVITDEMCLALCQIAQLPEKAWFHVLAIMAGKGFIQTCDWITQHKVNSNNIELCISEYSEFAFYKGNGIYDEVLTQLSHKIQ